MKSISIKPKRNGYVFDIGEKGYIFDSPQEIITELQRYFSDPEAVEQEYANGAVDPAPTLLAAPTGLSANNTDTVYPILSWDAVSEATSYFVEIVADGVFLTDVGVESATYQPDFEMQEGVQYVFKVQSHNSETTSEWSQEKSFQIVLPAEESESFYVYTDNTA